MRQCRRRLGLIGCGHIGTAVLAAHRAGQLPDWDISSVLVRRPRPDRDALFTTELDRFLSTAPHLVVEMAGPLGLAAIGEAVLRHAPMWTISAAALANEDLMQRLQAVGTETGHRLRVLPGAIAGLDGVSAAAASPWHTLSLHVDLPPGDEPAGPRFSGSVRQAAQLFPNAVNVAVAAALCGPGLDASQIEVHHPGRVARHRIGLRVEGAAGHLDVAIEPDLSQGAHPVACSIVAALRRETQVVWVG